MYVITEKLRNELKKPFGRLIVPDGKKYRELREKTKCLIMVGDICAYNALEAGVEPDIIVYDNKVKRMEVSEEVKKKLENHPVKKLVGENPAGTLSDRIFEKVGKAIESLPAKIKINGEEDLLVIPCVLKGDFDSTVCYGQPDEGLVVIEINAETKTRIKDILSEMEVKE